ncbi:MAG: hypothetical protein ABIY50_10250 [Ignavibacteria bacterium]
MIGKFVQGKINIESDVINSITDFSRESIVRSNLSEFTKNYILADFSQKEDAEMLLLKVEKSNKLYFNFTIRPKWTLLTFIFNNFESRPPKEILKKLDTFPFYKFYADSIKDFINDNLQIFTTKGEISTLIDETNTAIYDKLTKDITNQKIKNFFLQLFKLKYDDESNYNLESSIPYSFIKIFLIDKDYNDLEKKFQKAINIQPETEINLKDIIKVLMDKYSHSERNEEKKIIEKEAEVRIEPVSINKNEPIKAAPVKFTKHEAINVKNESINIYSGDLLKAAEEEKDLDAIAIPIDKAKKIKELIGKKAADRILTKIYNSDIIYQERSFEKLGSYNSWSEAKNHLKEIFQINKVEIYNKDVVRFVDVLNEHFNKTE